MQNYFSQFLKSFKNANIALIMLLSLFICVSNAQAKIVIFDTTDDTEVIEKKSRTPFKEADNGADMRKSRRFGAGFQLAGALGFGGAILDLNFTPRWSFGAGFGGGEGFQAFKLEGRYVLMGDWLMPYFSFGYAHWSSIGKAGYIQKTNPGFLAERFLTQDEKIAGEYRKHILYPGFGLQFMQLTGQWAGFSLLAELTALLDLNGFVAVPTATISTLYYF